MGLKISSMEITIDGTTYRACDVEEVKKPVEKRRLILRVIRYHIGIPDPRFIGPDENVTDALLEHRVRSVCSTFYRKFYIDLTCSGLRTFDDFSERVCVLHDAHPDHTIWAEAAKECGLIDSYLVDYDPEEKGD